MGMGDGTHLAAPELPVMILALVPLGCLMFVSSHRAAFAMALGALVTGFVIAGGSTPAWQKGHLNGFDQFILAGAGLNVAYIPCHSLLFERFIALFREPDNAGYLIKHAIHGSS